LQLEIGQPEDDSRLIEQTKQQILHRLGGSYTDLFIEKINKNAFKLKASK
jgi:hypothetical protein